MTDATPAILVVDDDPDLCELVAEVLRPHGFRVGVAAGGAAMRAALARTAVDLVILDIMLPDEDGLSLCRALRSDPATRHVGIVMLTAMASETDRVVGLETGADDYLPKPFGARELLARVKAVLRRAGAPRGGAGTPGDEAEASGILRFNGWRLDIVRRRLIDPGEVLVDLTAGEFDLLLTFLRHPQQVLNRDQLLDLARGRVAGPFDRTIDVQVGRLRRKVESDPKRPEIIKTVRGGGYICAAVVTEE